MNSTRLLLLSLICVMPSCNGAFRQEWKSALVASQAPGSTEGAWEGRWLSESNGHTGRLRAVVGPLVGSTRPVHYHATWGRILSGSFRAKHLTHGKEGITTFIVDEPLGRYGQFKAEGMITGDVFKAKYSAVGDRGTFDLRRPLPR